MSNTLLTIGMITNEALMVLENELTFTRNINREYDDKFGQEGAKIGTTVNARLPVRYVYASGQGLVLQDATETQVPVTLTTQYQRAFTFSSADLKLSVDRFSDRFVKPAIASMANQIDNDGLRQYLNIYNAVGTPGTVPSATSVYLDAGVKLSNGACPLDSRCLVINPQMQATAVDTVKGLFNPQANISDYTRKGMVARMFLGLDWYMDQNVVAHTSGAYGGTPLINGAMSNVSSLTTDGWTASAAILKRGDIITIGTSATSSDAVQGVNPQSREATGQLQQFVVTADVTADGSGNATIPISPALTISGAFQTVNQAAANNTPINVFGAASTVSPQGLAFHPDAFTFVNADLPLPGGVDMASRKASKLAGLSIRLVRAYDINTDRFPTRLDLLGGWATLRPELACRVAS